jgi:hypothetical protein
VLLIGIHHTEGLAFNTPLLISAWRLVHVLTTLATTERATVSQPRTTSTLILMLAFSGLSRAVFSQAADGNIQGTAFDQQGQLRAHATVRTVNVVTGLARTTVTADDGTFKILALPPGVYKVSTLGDGAVQEDERMVNVLVGQTSSVDFRKPVRIAEQVTVAADTSLIQIGQSQVDHVVSGIEIETLPINGRTFQQLAVLTPGVGAAIQIDPTKSHVGAISISAGAGRHVNARVDGGDNNDDVVGSFLQQYSQEAIQEFAVVTDLYKAEFGFASDGLINAITKAGSNAFHGTAFGFFRNQALNSETYFEKQLQTGKPPFRRDQWGGTFGGPIRRDAAQFFLSYERQNQREFTPFATGGVFPALDRLIPQPFNQDLFLAKLSGTRGRHTYALRVGTDTESEAGTGADGRHAPDATANTTNDYWSALFSDTMVVSDHRLNQFLVQANSFRNRIAPAEPANTYTIVTPTADFFRYSLASQGTDELKFQLKDDFSIEIPGRRGDHLLKFGGEYWREPKVGGELQFFQNVFVYDTDQAVVVMNGKPTPRPFSAVQPVFFLTYTGTGVFGNEPFNWAAGYIQDDWRIGRLTLNLGARYELQNGLWREHNVPGENRLRSTGYQGPGPSDDRDNVAWRTGFSYDVTGQGTTVLRGGWGRYFNRMLIVNSYAGKLFELTPPFIPVQIANPTFGPLEMPSTFSQVNPSSPEVRQEAVDAKNENSYADQLSIGIERQLTPDTAIDLDYLHTNSRNLPMSININYIGPDGKRVLFPDLGDFDYVTTIGRGSYDGLKIRVQHRLSRGFQVQGSYTLSRSRSIGDGVNPTPLNQADPLNKDEFGPLSNHETHHGVVSGIVFLPRGVQVSGLLQASSPRPYTAYTNGDINGDGVTGDRVEPFNARRGAALFSLDVRGTKAIRLRQGMHVDLMFEVFNLTNRANFGNFYVGNVDSPQFGQPSGQLLTPPRQAQVGARLTF